MTSAVGTTDRAALAALSALPKVGPARLRALLAGRSPAEAWRQVVAGRVPLDEPLLAASVPARAADLVSCWADAARAVDPADVLRHHRSAGVHVLCPDDDLWPAALRDDPEPPAVLFALGEPAAAGTTPSVAIVGTRTATSYGIEVARLLGHRLASVGLPVVSGLAAGIDGAGHHGALDAGGAAPVAVVGSGLDVVYPRGHRRLWQRVAEAGVVVSEWPLGTRPTRWRFPARNRIIAGLAGAVVVVESAAAGGAMHTVEEAVRRDRPVLAVPGPVTSRASVGTNRLLADGALAACDAGDVLVALGLGGTDAAPRAAPVPPPGGEAGRLLDAVGWRPSTLDQVVLRTGLPLERVAALGAELERDGWLAVDGGWFERRR